MTTGNVLKFKANSLSKSSKIKVTKSRKSPIIETSLAENLIIKRFLSFALEDVKFQMEMIQKSDLDEQKIKENLLASSFIIEYLTVLVKEVQRGIHATSNDGNER